LFIVGQLLFRPATQEAGKALGGVSKNYLVPTKDEVAKGINESGREKVGPAPKVERLLMTFAMIMTLGMICLILPASMYR
jgi:hypothetical protein